MVESRMVEYEVRYGGDVLRALNDHQPVVALESTIISHGLPRPRNIEVARQIEQTVRDHGAVPATIGMIGGRVIVGLDDDQVVRLATVDGVHKLSVRDLAVAAVAGSDGATTVAATAALAAHAGIDLFATGGLGGVHRGAAETYDESADLGALGRTSIMVVCAGVKSILDVGATLERLESLGVTVIGYRTRRFPGFYLTDSGFNLDWSLDGPGEFAEVLRARRAHGVQAGAVVVANPLPADEQIDPALHDRLLAEGLAGLAIEGITGKAVTPYLLAHFHEQSAGASLTANIKIILRNAELAARIAVAHAALPVAARPVAA
jgi:pseudouridylate synthase